MSQVGDLDPFRAEIRLVASTAGELAERCRLLLSSMEPHAVEETDDETPDHPFNFAMGSIGGAVEELEGIQELLASTASLTDDAVQELWEEATREQ